jgi:hypothetical protein
MSIVDLGIPVQQFPPSVEAAELGNTLLQLRRHERTGLPHPTDWKLSKQQWLQHLGARSARAFFQDCKVCSVEYSNDQFEIWATKTNGVGSSECIGQPLVVSEEDAITLGKGVLRMLEQSQR